MDNQFFTSKQAEFEVGALVQVRDQIYQTVVHARTFNENKGVWYYMCFDENDGFFRAGTAASNFELIKPVEMTLKEVCAALGKEIKIVK